MHSLSRTSRCLLYVFASLPFSGAAALACAVCGFGEDQSRGAYLATTFVLSLLPLALIGGALLYLRRRYRQQQGGRTEEQTCRPDPHTPRPLQ